MCTYIYYGTMINLVITRSTVRRQCTVQAWHSSFTSISTFQSLCHNQIPDMPTRYIHRFIIYCTNFITNTPYLTRSWCNLFSRITDFHWHDKAIIWHHQINDFHGAHKRKWKFRFSVSWTLLYLVQQLYDWNEWLYILYRKGLCR